MNWIEIQNKWPLEIAFSNFLCPASYILIRFSTTKAKPKPTPRFDRPSRYQSSRSLWKTTTVISFEWGPTLYRQIPPQVIRMPDRRHTYARKPCRLAAIIGGTQRPQRVLHLANWCSLARPAPKRKEEDAHIGLRPPRRHRAAAVLLRADYNAGRPAADKIARTRRTYRLSTSWEREIACTRYTFWKRPRSSPSGDSCRAEIRVELNEHVGYVYILYTSWIYIRSAGFLFTRRPPHFFPLYFRRAKHCVYIIGILSFRQREAAQSAQEARNWGYLAGHGSRAYSFLRPEVRLKEAQKWSICGELLFLVARTKSGFFTRFAEFSVRGSGAVVSGVYIFNFFEAGKRGRWSKTCVNNSWR